MKSRAGRFAAMPRKEKLLAAEAVMTLYISWLKIQFMSLRRLTNMGKETAITGLSNDQDSSKAIKSIKTALRRADRFSFWRNRCLVSSFAGKKMLSRRGIESSIYLGARLDEGGRLKAHAWLKSGDFEVVEKSGEFSELYVL